jgi:hypothetical protein
MKLSFVQLSLFDVTPYCRNFQLLSCNRISDIDLNKLDDLFPRELKPICEKFGIKSHGNVGLIRRRLKRFYYREREKRILG